MLDQAFLRLRRVVAGADEADDLVDVQEGDEEALDQVVGAVALLAAAELTAAAHDVEAVVEIDLEEFLEAQGERLTVHQRHVVDAEGLLHRRQLVELLRTASGTKPFLISMTRRSPCERSVRSLTSAMPWSFLALTRSLILLITFSGPTVKGSSVTTRPLRRAVTSSTDTVARILKVPRPDAGVPDPGQADHLAARGQVWARHVLHQRVQVGARIADQVAGRPR